MTGKTKRLLLTMFTVTMMFSLFAVVAQVANAAVTLAVDKKTYMLGETVTISYSGVVIEDPDDSIVWIAIAERDMAEGDHISGGWELLVQSSGTSIWENILWDDGAYEVRLYQGNTPDDDDWVWYKEVTVPFTVGASGGVETQPIETTSVATSFPAADVAVGALTPLVIDTGVKLEWNVVPGALGYRVYRSRTAGTEGLSITDFMITEAKFIDVNVDARTTYYYTLRAVMKEVTATGEREQLSSSSAEINVTTGEMVLGGDFSVLNGKIKHVILMKLKDPNMSVDGIKQEIDPGRGTTPENLNGRTIVPIRAIIEAMGGTAGWEDATQRILLNATGQLVEMWLNKKDLVVNGQPKEMDVAPVSVNGRTMVPLRFAAENVGCVVDWISSTDEIIVVFYTT